jgi:hypothetical protein
MPVEFVNIADVSVGSVGLSLMRIRVRQLALS